MSDEQEFNQERDHELDPDDTQDEYANESGDEIEAPETVDVLDGDEDEAVLQEPASHVPPIRAQDRSEENAVPSSISEQERLRHPRAQSFKRRLRNQLSFLPIAIFLVLLSVFLIGRHERADNWPEYSDLELIAAGVLVLGFSAVLHALLFGRRERGLIFVGLLVWVTAGELLLLVTLVEESPDFAEWWPAFLVALGIALLLTYMVERLHDARLVLLSLIVLVTAVTSYVVTSGSLADDRVTDAGDYWPLLFVLMGVGMLPLAFRRRTG